MLCLLPAQRRYASVGSLLSLLLVSVAALSISGCKQLGIESVAERNAKARVELVLKAVRDAGDSTETQLQSAICTWYNNTLLINDMGILGAASDGFDDWRRAGGIYPTLQTYEIGKAETEDEPGGPVVYVSVKVDNHPWRWVRVPNKAAISWAD
jgi:hypothetical protein